MAEGVNERYRREYLELGDSRKTRGFDNKSAERRSREYVAPDNVGVSTATDEDGREIRTVTGTVTATGDNDNPGVDWPNNPA